MVAAADFHQPPASVEAFSNNNHYRSPVLLEQASTGIMHCIQ